MTNILANKQSRGTFGQGRMEAIVATICRPAPWPHSRRRSQGRSAAGLPGLHAERAPPLVIDAKFPLEGFNAVKAAESAEALKAAQQLFRGDLGSAPQGYPLSS